MYLTAGFLLCVIICSVLYHFANHLGQIYSSSEDELVIVKQVSFEEKIKQLERERVSSVQKEVIALSFVIFRVTLTSP